MITSDEFVSDGIVLNFKVNRSISRAFPDLQGFTRYTFFFSFKDHDKRSIREHILYFIDKYELEEWHTSNAAQLVSWRINDEVSGLCD